MPVEVIAEIDPFTRTRVTVTTDPKPVAEIINGLRGRFPLSQARACRNGEIVTDFSTMTGDGDRLEVRFVPNGGGGSSSPQETGESMKLVGAGVTGLGILLTGVGLGAVGLPLIGVGVGLMAGGAVLTSIDTSQKVKDRETPKNDPSIRGGKNQARQYGRIPVLFGRHRIYPDLAANPFTSIIDGRQYYTQLFCGGYKDCVIDASSFKLGETYLSDFSDGGGVSMEILQNGEASTLYPVCVHEDAVNAPLKNQIESADGGKISGAYICTTPDYTDTVNVDIFFHNGLGKYNDKGDLGTASVEVRAWFKHFGAPDSTYALLGNFNGGGNAMSAAELKTLRYQVTRPGLARGKYNVKIERVTADSSDGKVVDQVYVGSVRSMKTTDERGNAVRPIRAERQKDLTVIALRVLATSKLNGTVDSFNYVATATMPVYSGGGSGARYWGEGMTSNPASALLHALKGRAAQQRVGDDDVDWASLEAFHEWCARKDGDGDFKYECNAYLSESVTIAELLRMIGGTARADILRIDSKISVVQDIKRHAPVQLFTPKNTVSYSITMFSADIPEAVGLRFIDKGAGYAHQELKVYNTPDGNRQNGKEPDTVQTADLWGVTGSKQARRIGMYNYACLKNRPFVHTVEADIEYLICGKGDWIQYAGDIALAGSVQGRIKGVIWADGVCVGIDTDEPVVMTEGGQHAVRIRLSNGIVILKDTVFNPGELRRKSIPYHPGEGEKLYEPHIGDFYAVDEDNVYYEPQNVIFFKEPLQREDAPKAGDIYAFGARGYEALDLIITDIQPGQNLTAVLTCVEYSPEIFGVDEPGFVLPEFVNKITPVSGAVDSGVINPDRWKSFAVYHDGENEPSRPSGDGLGGGWHNAETFRSVWKSSKIAESAESGEWGMPVRIRAERGDEDVTPIWLWLSQADVSLATDGDGNALSALFPVTVQARLFKWNSALAGAAFSMTGAPSGVTINSNGVITVSAGAALAQTNNITVRAAYQGGEYSAALSITKSLNYSAPRYLGTVRELQTASAAATIIKGPVTGTVSARQGDYVLTISAAAGAASGSVFQWDGAAWKYRPMDGYTSLYTSCFKDGLDAIADNNTQWFGAVIAKKLMAVEALIEELQSEVITLKNGGMIKSSNYDAAAPESSRQGFALRHDGYLEAVNGKFNNGVFKDMTITGNLEMKVKLGSSGQAQHGQITSSVGGFFIGIITAEFDNLTEQGVDGNLVRCIGDILWSGRGATVGSHRIVVDTAEIAKDCIILGTNSDNGKVVKASYSGKGVNILNYDANGQLKNSSRISVLIV
jgi:hypothetical protein